MYNIYDIIEKASWWLGQKSIRVYAWASTNKIRCLYTKYENILK